MPYSRFTPRLTFLSTVIAIAVALPARAADWRECEAAKLRALQLQHGSEHKTAKRKSRARANGSQQSAEDIDTWLWKNCREFSYELRQLEQDKM